MLFLSEDEQVIMAVTDSTIMESNDKSFLLLDSGATSHLTNSMEGMKDIVKTDTNIWIGDGTTLKATKEGVKKMTVVQVDGTYQDVNLLVKFVPNICMNIISMNRLLDKGFSVLNVGPKIILKKHNFILNFDRTIKGSSTNLRGIRMVPHCDKAMVNMENRRIPIMQLHHKLGHANEAVTRQMAKDFGWKISGKFQVCAGCSVARAKQTSVPKTNDNKSMVKGELLCIDISSMKGKSYGEASFGYSWWMKQWIIYGCFS